MSDSDGNTPDSPDSGQSQFTFTITGHSGFEKPPEVVSGGLTLIPALPVEKNDISALGRAKRRWQCEEVRVIES